MTAHAITASSDEAKGRALSLLREAGRAVGQLAPSRATSLSKTKIDEAIHWLLHEEC